MKIRTVIALLALGIFLTGCLPGSDLGGTLSSSRSPADEVFISLLTAVEQRRADQFVLNVAQSATPDRDNIWKSLTDFFKIADNIEFQVTVERRGKSENAEKHSYLFTWDRKYNDRATGNVVTVRGQSEWSLDGSSGRFLLTQMAGDPLF